VGRPMCSMSCELALVAGRPARLRCERGSVVVVQPTAPLANSWRGSDEARDRHGPAGDVVAAKFDPPGRPVPPLGGTWRLPLAYRPLVYDLDRFAMAAGGSYTAPVWESAHRRGGSRSGPSLLVSSGCPNGNRRASVCEIDHHLTR
jgi:hypothetical protein